MKVMAAWVDEGNGGLGLMKVMSAWVDEGNVGLG